MTLKKEAGVLAVIGNPISHSKSPQMQQRAIDQLNLPYRYVPLRIESDKTLKSLFELVKGSNIKGLNVTVPYKESVMQYLDEISPEASAIGAVNTIVNKSGRLFGYNTDGDGFLMTLSPYLKDGVKAKRVAILGAGGSAKAISYAVCGSQCKELLILNRTVDKATRLRNGLIQYFPEVTITAGTLSDTIALKECDLVVNTTSVGMEASLAESPLSSYEWVTPGVLCYDIIYKPEQTTFLKTCISRGAKGINGSGMLAGQGCLALKLMTGKTVTYEEMKKGL